MDIIITDISITKILVKSRLNMVANARLALYIAHYHTHQNNPYESMAEMAKQGASSKIYVLYQCKIFSSSDTGSK